MSFQFPPRRAAVLASVLAAAGVMLTVASCTGHLTPLGPDAGPPPQQLRSPIVLQPLRIQQATPAGGCPAGYVALSGGSPGQCYGMTGVPDTITSAAVSPVNLTAITSPAPSSGPPVPGSGRTARYGFVVAVPAAEVQALTAVITAADNEGAFAISVAGQTWAIAPAPPAMRSPRAHAQFQVLLPSRKQALQLQRMLASSGL